MHQNPDKHYFQLHVSSNPNHAPQHVAHHTPEPQPEPHKHEEPKKRTVKGILKDASRQIIASALILIVGVIILNWSAYYQIAKSEFNQLFGIEQADTPLDDLVVYKTPQEPEDVAINTSTNPEVQKKQIPELNLEVTPSDNRLIIPRINKNIPIVRVSSEALVNRDWAALEAEMQGALRNGVVHYPGTSLPGQDGNSAITGHSSYFPWDSGRFKDVFALLHDVVEGDRIVVYWDQQKYLYEVVNIKIVLPQDISILKQTPENQITLITCTPVGTNLKRLVVTAKRIDAPADEGEEKVIRRT